MQGILTMPKFAYSCGIATAIRAATSCNGLSGRYSQATTYVGGLLCGAIHNRQRSYLRLKF